MQYLQIHSNFIKVKTRTHQQPKQIYNKKLIETVIKITLKDIPGAQMDSQQNPSDFQRISTTNTS